MKINGWGCYPIIQSDVYSPYTPASLSDYLSAENSFIGIARGLGRSYGDSSLSEKTINTHHFDSFISFDEKSGLLNCNAGMTFDEILKIFVPQGWFLPVTPGTKFVTVGGAIASDVHGKNHHLSGCFSEHLFSFKLALPSGEILSCSINENTELFHASCGGMGLTGIIISACFKLIPIKSAYIKEKTIKAQNLKEIMGLFDENTDTTYSVAWIDCLSTGEDLGRTLMSLGEHAETGGLHSGKPAKLNIPFNMPNQLLNPLSIKIFNTLYYQRINAKVSEKIVHYEPFFYPLDGIYNWNRLYGSTGFMQYQFVLPKEAGFEGMSNILSRISESKRGSFLAVLKAFGKENKNYLSFPQEGYTLALDFKITSGITKLLNELDSIVTDFSGRIYLTKDARMSRETFEQTYPNKQKFVVLRKKYKLDKLIQSLQSRRLGI